MSFPGNPNAIPRASVSSIDRQSQSLREVEEKKAAGYNAVAVDDGATPRAVFEFPRRKVDISTIITDVSSVALPLAMASFVIAVWSVDGAHVVEDSHASWINAISVLATAFPILVASIVGRLMSEAARWKLERGAIVGSVEQLIGSRTVGATALTIIQFRSLNLLSAVLLVAWALSPLGAQSLLPVVELRVDSEAQPSTAAYFDNSAESKIVDWADIEVSGTGLIVQDAHYRSLASLYTSSITAPEVVKLDTMDLWGNVKIPFPSELEDDDWTNTPHDASLIRYSSLAVVPIQNMNNNANTTFFVESGYIHLDCSNLTVLTSKAEIDSKKVADRVKNDMLNFAVRSNMGISHPEKTHDTQRLSSWSLALDRFVRPWWSGYNDTARPGSEYRTRGRIDKLRPASFRDQGGFEAGPTNLRLDAYCSSTFFFTEAYPRAQCRVTQRYVESRVLCSRGVSARQNCSVVAQRPSQLKHATSDMSDLSFPTVFRAVSEELPRTIGGGLVSYQTEASLYYLQDRMLRGLRESEKAFLENVTAEEISVRLAQLLNTYVQLSKLYVNLTGGSVEDAMFEPNITTASVSSRDVVLYNISAPWAALCLVSSLVLIGAGLLSVVFKHKAKGPEVLGYALTVLRDSRYMDLDFGAGLMDGMELSKSMKHRRIRYGFVRAKENGEPMIGVGEQHETGQIHDGRH